MMGLLHARRDVNMVTGRESARRGFRLFATGLWIQKEAPRLFLLLNSLFFRDQISLIPNIDFALPTVSYYQLCHQQLYILPRKISDPIRLYLIPPMMK